MYSCMCEILMPALSPTMEEGTLVARPCQPGAGPAGKPPTGYSSQLYL